jgi:hypothetical protein
MAASRRFKQAVKRFPKMAAMAGALTLAACGPDRPTAPAPAPPPPASAGYIQPPAVDVATVAAGQVALSGVAAPGARVRLANPEGAASVATADAKGRWSLTLPGSGQARIFGLSMMAQERQVQGQGYLLLTPAGRGVLLRAGAGAVVLGATEPARITALDFDGEGGAIVSGTAPANGAVSVTAGGRAAATGKADPSGRYAIAINQPLDPGAQRIVVKGDGFTAAAGLEIGLLVDDVVEVRQVVRATIGPTLLEAAGPTRPLTVGVTPDLLAVLNIEALLADPRLIVQA